MNGKRTLFLRAVLGFLALSGAAALRAENRSILSVGILALECFPISPGEFSDKYALGSAFGVRLRRDIDDRWTLGGQFANYVFRGKGSLDETITLQPVTFIAQRRFFDSRTWAPAAHATLGVSRNSRDRLSNNSSNTGLAAGLGASFQWNFADLASLAFEAGVRHFGGGAPAGGALRAADAGILFSFYLPESWVPLAPKEELSLEDLEIPLEGAPGQVDESLQTQGEINRILQQIEDGKVLPVTFEMGNSIMLTTSYEALDNIGAVVRRHPEMRLRIYGFIEEEFTGGPVRAETLALARAETVRTYLLQNFRLPEDTLISAGLPPLPAILEGEKPPEPPRHISFEVVP